MGGIDRRKRMPEDHSRLRRQQGAGTGPVELAGVPDKRDARGGVAWSGMWCSDPATPRGPARPRLPCQQAPDRPAVTPGGSPLRSGKSQDRDRSAIGSFGQGEVATMLCCEVAYDAKAEARNRSDSLLGTDGEGPLRRQSDRSVTRLGTTLGGRQGRWIWTATGTYDRSGVEVRTDIPAASGRRNAARSADRRFEADLVLTGPVVDLPAGALSATIGGGIGARDFESRSSLDDVDQDPLISRDRGIVRGSLDLPLLRRGKFSPFGTLSVNANSAVERLSDAGSLRTFGYGLNWSPVEAVSIIASATNEQGAPTLEQLGGPQLLTPNMRTFDFGRGEVVDVTRVSGGNRRLRADDRHVVRLGMNVRPLAPTDLTLSVDYVATRIDDPIAAFPIATPKIEAAFPDRFTRDAEGRLFRIDARPLNFAGSRQAQLRWGFNFTRPLGPVPPAMQNASVRVFASEAEARRAHPGAIFSRAEPGSAMAQGAGNLTSRVFVSLYHNWYLKDAITVREGSPALDLLSGDAVDVRGGTRRHEVAVQAGVFKRGLGARLTANWQGGSEIRGSNGAAGDLYFGDLATVNVTFFANLAERFGGSGAPGWLKGARATLGITNLFGTRPDVRDRVGATPLSYQSAYLDPLGRVINISLRKTM